MKKGFGIAGFVISIIAISFSFLKIFGLFFPILSIPLGILGIIFTKIQYKKGKTGLAKAGFIISIIAIIAGIFYIIAFFVVRYMVSSLLTR